MVRLFMDFDSTITEESTLMQIYIRLPKETFKKTVEISNEDYYKVEEKYTNKTYSNIFAIIKSTTDWNSCLKAITAEVFRYSKEIEGIEMRGVNLIEPCLKELDIFGLWGHVACSACVNGDPVIDKISSILKRRVYETKYKSPHGVDVYKFVQEEFCQKEQKQ